MLTSKAKIKSGLFAVTLGITAALCPVTNPVSLWEGVAVAQVPVVTSPQPHIAYPVAQPNATPHAAVPMRMAMTQPATSAAPSAEQLYQISGQKLLQARESLAGKDVVTAERLASEVKAMNLTYRQHDDRPDFIFNLLNEYRNCLAEQEKQGITEQTRRIYARYVLYQADGLIRFGKLDLASQLVHEAASQNLLYNEADRQSGIEPMVMAKKIEDAKRIRAQFSQPLIPVPNQPMQRLSAAAETDLYNAISMLAQARAELAKMNFDRAEQLCQTAIATYKLPDAAFQQYGAETPNRILAEIAMMRQQSPVVPTRSNVVALNPAANPMVQPVPASVNPTVAAPAVYNNAPGQEAAILQVRDSNGLNPIPASPIITKVQQEQLAVIQQVAADLTSLIASSRKFAEKGDENNALRVLDEARQRINQSNIDPRQKAMYNESVNKAVAEVTKSMDQYRVTNSLDQRNQDVLNEIRLDIEERKHRQEKLKSYFAECNKLINERRFDEALIIAKKARDLDPDDPATNLLLATTQMAANVRTVDEIHSLKHIANFNTLTDVDRSAVYPNFGEKPLHPDRARSALARNRQTMDEKIWQDRPESERVIFRALEQPVSLFVDKPIPLEQVLMHLQGQVPIHIFMDYTSLQEVDVTSETLVRLQLMKDIKLKSVLNVILGQLNLAYVVEDEVLKITSKAKAKGSLSYRTYYVGDIIMKIPNFDGRQNPFDMENSINRAMSNQPVRATGAQHAAAGGLYASNLQNIAVDPNMIANAVTDGNGNTLAQRMGNNNMMGGAGYSGLGGNVGFGQQPQYGSGMQQPGAAGGSSADFSEIMELIELVVSPDSWGDDAGTMSQYNPTLSLVVRQTEEVHAEIVDLLAQLRKLNDLQIAVEVRFISLSDSFQEKMGVDFDMIFKNNGAAGRVTTGGTVSTSGGTTTVTGGKNVTLGLTAPGNFTADLSIPLLQNTLDLVSPANFDANSGMNVGFALLSDIEAYFFMTAAQSDTRSNVLQAPKVTIFNGQMGAVMDMSMNPFVTSVIPVVGDFAAAYQPIIVVLNEGQFMTVQGVVTSNRQNVRLTLNPVFSKITKVESYKYVGDYSQSETTETGSKGNDQSSASADDRDSKNTKTQAGSGVTIQLPVQATLSVQTTVSVPDGGTILLGGIKRLNEGRKEAGVPIMNKLPFINRLFSNNAVSRDTSSMMMMVTPRIIIQEEEEEFITGMSSNN